jgi:hypothetical protein
MGKLGSSSESLDVLHTGGAASGGELQQRHGRGRVRMGREALWRRWERGQPWAAGLEGSVRGVGAHPAEKLRV